MATRARTDQVSALLAIRVTDNVSFLVATITPRENHDEKMFAS